MTIKQQGGVFGRNPSFNDATVEDLTVTGSVNVPNDSISGNAINGGTATPTTLLVNTTTNPNSRNARVFGITEFDSAGATLVTFLTSNGATSLGAIGQGNYVVSGAPSNSFGIRSDVNLPIAAGGTTKVADFTVNGLAFVDGKGIDFSATSGTGTSELFDDYEEGTWTPTLKALTTDFDSVTYDAIRSASYTKVGRVVQIQLTMRTDAITVGSATGLLAIGGLPFTPVTGNVGASSLSVSVGSTFASNTPMAAEVSGGANDIYLLYRSSVSGNTAYCQAADAATGANANYVRISGTYTTS